MVAAMNRTEPSQNPARNPPGRMPTDLATDYPRGTKSSGLVQITAAASLASTTMIVLDVPSVILANDSPTGWLRRPFGRRHEHSVFAGVTQVDRFPRLRHTIGRPIDLRHAGDQCLVVLAIPRFVQVELLIERLLLDEGQMCTRQLSSGLPSLSTL